MNGAMLWNNFLVYCLQLGLLIGAAGWLPSALRMRAPKARLLFLQALLAACLMIPLIQPWRSEVVTATVQVSTGQSVPVVALSAGRAWHISPLEIVFMVLLLGCLARLFLLAAGLWRLRRYRSQSIPFDPAPAWAVEADLRLSSEVTSPVTFGLVRPVILLPADFTEMDAGLQEAVLCHEVLHVRRRDWLTMLGEEFVRAGLWFHPAIWWLLGEIQLAREQTVDRAVIDVTRAREKYVDALLTVAGAALQMDLAPAPLFLRKRHLKQRVISILKEKSMSKTRTVSTLATGIALLAGACWFVTSAFPLSAAPQTITDASGVAVDTQGARLMHRSPVSYPRDAQIAGVEGSVVAQVTLDANGNVSDATILSGPQPLRKAVLESLLTWHYTKDAAGGSRQVTVTFRLPDPGTQAAPKGGSSPQIVDMAMRAPVNTVVRNPNGVPGTPGSMPADQMVTVKAIQLSGLGITDEEFLAKLPPLHVGDNVSRRALTDFMEAVRAVDEHLFVGISSDSTMPNSVTVQVRNPNALFRTMAETPKIAPPVPGAIPVGGNVQNNKLISKTPPEYPAIAKSARITGTVEMSALIGKDGHVQQLTVVSGHPLLRQAALDAVKTWVYEPTLLNEQPVAVSTTIDVIFSLNQ